MTYDPTTPLIAGGERTIAARIIKAARKRYGATIPDVMPDGDAAKLARVVGCSVWHVRTVVSQARRGYFPTGRAAPLQPGALPLRLLVLEREQPSLKRAEQAKILGTSVGMVRDTAYRLRLDGYMPYGEGRRARRRAA